jgi:hypothetical protein
MAGPKKAAKKKSSPAKRGATAKLSPRSKTTSVQKRSVRDPYRGPSSSRIERSLEKGTSISLNDFRSIIKWS